MVDKKNGDGNGKDNVIPFPTKKHKSDPKAIAYIVKEVMDDLIGQLTPEQRKDFEAFLTEEKPDLADKILPNWPKDWPNKEDMELVGEFSVDEINEQIDKSEALVDLNFEYIKNIEKAMFQMNSALQVEDLRDLQKKLQKLWFYVQKKVDFEK